jgi:hypothetical protein
MGASFNPSAFLKEYNPLNPATNPMPFARGRAAQNMAALTQQLSAAK